MLHLSAPGPLFHMIEATTWAPASSAQGISAVSQIKHGASKLIPAASARWKIEHLFTDVSSNASATKKHALMPAALTLG